MQDVTVVSCLYGSTHNEFAERWGHAVADMTVKPSEVIVAADEAHYVPGAIVIPSECTWDNPQAYYLTAAVSWVTTDWVWFLDIDDVAFPDALEGLDEVAADVWQLGYLRSDGEEYIPPQLSAAEVLASERNRFVAGSCVRTEAFRRVGGFRDIALQDWGLWLALAAAGASFESSGRAHFHYMRHPETRGERELDIQSRPGHMREMEAALA